MAPAQRPLEDGPSEPTSQEERLHVENEQGTRAGKVQNMLLILFHLRVSYQRNKPYFGKKQGTPGAKYLGTKFALTSMVPK